MRRRQRAQLFGGGRHAVRIGVPPAGKCGMGQGVGGGLRGVALEQCRCGGEQVSGAPNMTGCVLGMAAEMEHAAAQVILVGAHQGLVEQPFCACGVSGQPCGGGRSQPPPRRILWTSRKPSRMLGGSGSRGEPGPP
jgi:hypothetical protein